MGDCAIDVAKTKAPRTANVLLFAHTSVIGRDFSLVINRIKLKHKTVLVLSFVLFHCA